MTLQYISCTQHKLPVFNEMTLANRIIYPSETHLYLSVIHQQVQSYMTNQ